MKIHGIEIKDGYLLVVRLRDKRDNETLEFNMPVAHNADDRLACHAPSVNHYWDVNCFDTYGRYDEYARVAEILAIYGRTCNSKLFAHSVADRKLLWERKEPKKMTVAEICAALGYDVEIVKEKQK